MKLECLAVVAIGLCACGPTPPRKIPTPDIAREPAPVSGDLGPRMAARASGIPHSLNIDTVVLSPDASMAMSRDSGGGLRYWSSLDGSAQPALVPIRGARSLSLAKSDSGCTLAIVDAIGSLHILEADSSGAMRELFMSSPHTPIRQAEVLLGGERVLMLGNDHSVALLDRSGKILSSVQERRFRPSDFRVTEEGRTVVTLHGDVGPAGMTVTMRYLHVDRDQDTLGLAKEEIEISGVRSLADNQFAISPDGRHLAFMGTVAKTAKVVPTQEAVAAPTAPIDPVSPPLLSAAAAATLIVWDVAKKRAEAVDLNLPQAEIATVALGFADDQTIILTSRPSGGSWRVVLGAETASYGLPSAVALDTQRSASDVAKGVHVAADGIWLFVQELKSETHHYLGYSAFDPQFASLSPSGNRVAWVTSLMIFVEDLRDGEVPGESKIVRLSAPPAEAYFRASFIDEAHLVTVDYSGALHIVAWQSGEVVATLDTGGAVREIEVDQQRKLIRGVRQSGGSWLCEWTAASLLGPYLIQDQGFQSGFLSGNDALWTLDSKLRYRSYSLAALRAGLRAKDLMAEATAPEGMAPLHIDAHGRRYTAAATSNAAQLLIRDASGKAVQTLKLMWTPLQVHPSPDGARVALLSPDATILEVYDLATGASLWSTRIVTGLRHVIWSADSSRLALASQVGALVLAAPSGEHIRLGCGPWFEKRSTPPATTLSSLRAPNLCESSS